MALTHDGESPGYAGVAVELPPAKAGGLAQSRAMTKVVNRTCLNAHESTHEGQSHRLKPVVFTKCVDNKVAPLCRQFIPLCRKRNGSLTPKVHKWHSHYPGLRVYSILRLNAQ